MHQPDYRDGRGIMQMPWVFLHAIKDYYDIPWMLSRHDGLRATFNITPPLITQLKLYYENPQENDKFLNLWMQDLELLNETDRNWMIKLCKSTPYETMVKPLPRYETLYKKEHYSDNELFDLQVLFILAWCGVYLKSNNTVIKALIEKSTNFNCDDKTLLLKELSGFIAGIFDFYKKLYNDGVIAISTTPLNHPILPLLMDMNNAKVANPSTNIPDQHICLEDDARLQVTRAMELFVDTFGFTPEGFWPAEGGVDEKSVALLHECGVKWIATDEAILFKSLQNGDRVNLYSPYRYKDICIGFRDHSLSDNIGFTYRYWEAGKAAEHFVSSLSAINKSNDKSTVFVILDGENAWEFFHNNAYDFFDALYTKLQNTPWCSTLNMDEVNKLPAKSLDVLAPGSWIHGEFNTWVGHKEKTRAWELIYISKRDYENHKEKLDDETKEKITEHFLASECSDWFWWYGDDHYTEFGSEFDILFRSHLIAVYDLMKIAPPADLFESIIGDRSSEDFLIEPQSNISPTINGLHDSFFEWVGCGVVDESKLFSTMDRVRGPIKKILYGQDEKYIYFAFDSNKQEICNCDTVAIIIKPISFNEKINFSGDKASSKEIFEDITIYVESNKILEIRIDKRSIKKDELYFRFEFFKDDEVIQTLPGFGELELDLTSDYSKNWFV
jgi:alpha-amylase/alpha-mannosidase (GH57 family)